MIFTPCLVAAPCSNHDVGCSQALIGNVVELTSLRVAEDTRANPVIILERLEKEEVVTSSFDFQQEEEVRLADPYQCNSLGFLPLVSGFISMEINKRAVKIRPATRWHISYILRAPSST